MRHSWDNAGGSLYLSGEWEHKVFASATTRTEFDWIINKIPEWAGCELALVTELDVTGGIDPSTLDDSELEEKVHQFIAANPSIFEHFTQDSLDYFTKSAKYFARYGADAAQGFGLEKEGQFCNILLSRILAVEIFQKTAWDVRWRCLLLMMRR